MKKYLNEISTAGMLLLFIGVIIGHTVGMQYGAWPSGLGLLLALLVVLFKAFHWKEYERDNKRNIAIMLIAILVMYLTMLIR